ncbi:hypothetical protein PDR5_05020 [Pseudomonas sp. DR 5-09]|nr:hypothetical protein PDR5_05020 [Pseudomonas sp. DR 5-09]
MFKTRAQYTDSGKRGFVDDQQRGRCRAMWERACSRNRSIS